MTGGLSPGFLDRHVNKFLYTLDKFKTREISGFYRREDGRSAKIFRFWWAFDETLAMGLPFPYCLIKPPFVISSLWIASCSPTHFA